MNSAELIKGVATVRFEWNSCVDLVRVIEPGRASWRDMQFAKEYWNLLILIGYEQKTKSQLMSDNTLP